MCVSIYIHMYQLQLFIPSLVRGSNSGISSGAVTSGKSTVTTNMHEVLCTAHLLLILVILC